MKKIIITSLILIALGVAGYGGYYQFIREEHKPDVEAGEALPEPDPVEPLFIKLHPPLVVNFTHQGVLRYLQATLEMMHTDQEVVDRLDKNMPIIRNNLIMLLSDQSYDDLSSKSAKENLRNRIAEVIEQTVPATPRVEVYLTSFVMQ